MITDNSLRTSTQLSIQPWDDDKCLSERGAVIENVLLKKFNDFKFEEWNKTDKYGYPINFKIAFEDCGHSIAFGMINAIVDNGLAISFGDGRALVNRVGHAISFGKGSAQVSMDGNAETYGLGRAFAGYKGHAIAHGDGDAHSSQGIALTFGKGDAYTGRAFSEYSKSYAIALGSGSVIANGYGTAVQNGTGGITLSGNAVMEALNSVVFTNFK